MEITMDIPDDLAVRLQSRRDHYYGNQIIRDFNFFYYATKHKRPMQPKKRVRFVFLLHDHSFIRRHRSMSAQVIQLTTNHARLFFFDKARLAFTAAFILSVTNCLGPILSFVA